MLLQQGFRLEKGCAGGQFRHFGCRAGNPVCQSMLQIILYIKRVQCLALLGYSVQAPAAVGSAEGWAACGGMVMQKVRLHRNLQDAALFIACPEVEVSKPGATTSKAGGQKGAALKEHTYRFSVIFCNYIAARGLPQS